MKQFFLTPFNHRIVIRRAILSCLIQILFLGFVDAQSELDSLKTLLLSSQEDTIRGKLYVNIAAQYSQTNQDKMLSYIDSAAAIQNYQKSIEGRAGINQMYGRYHIAQNNLDTAFILLNLALTDYIKLNDSSGFTNVYYNLGDIERRRTHWDTASDYFIKTKELYELQDNQTMVAGCLNALGIVYKNLNQNDKAIGYYKEAKHAFQKLKSTFNTAIAALNIGNLYNKQHQFKEAISEFDQVLQISNSMNDDRMKAYAFSSLGTSYYSQNDLSKALEMYEKSYAIRKSNSTPEELCNILINLGNVSKDNNKLSKARMYYEEALVLAEEKDILDAKNSSYGGLAIIHRQLANYNLAFDYLNKSKIIEDSINNITTRQAAMDLNAKYETEKKEQEIAMLNIQNENTSLKLSSSRKFSYLLVGILGLTLLFLYQFCRLNKRINTQNSIISKSLDEKNILLREIHHRVKNNLQVISSLLSLQSNYTKDPDIESALQEGKNRVKSMSLIHQNLYQQDNLTGVDVPDYFRKLFNSLFNSYNIHPDRIKLQMDISELNLDIDSIIPIGLVVNEMVSNSLKYAFPDNRKGMIKIGLKEADGELQLSVEDNGIGMDTSSISNTNENFGFTLIHAFKEKLNADLEVKSQAGTKILLNIRNYKKVA